MILNNLDMIVRRSLLEIGYPIHWYSELLYHGSAAIRELSFDTLKIVNTVNLPVDSYGAADLPMDYVDEVAVALNGGAILQPIPHKHNINPLRLVDTTTSQFIQQTNPQIAVDNSLSFWATAGFFWFWNVSDWGEPTGRFFGASGGSRTGYDIILPRRQLQLTGQFNAGSVILQYISDGQRIDNATQITPQAFATIQAYINWKRSPNASIKNSHEAATYYNEKRTLRMRLDNITVADIKDVIRSNYTAAKKS